ncbi:MAG: hypothetical protein DRP78_06935 [Candidatus Omnitrophota bacterium]|nr:MAG: hypothetical protein DRP78_06935 [Candidatus Omnitrophota bacterium]
MGKLVRTICGHMVDLILDIRKGSPNFGKIIAYDLPANKDKDYNEWIWLPPGFAHGNCFFSDTYIEYFCSAEYSPGCEAGISPLAQDIDWSICDLDLKNKIKPMIKTTQLITDKDKNAFTLASWQSDRRSDNFIYIQT